MAFNDIFTVLKKSKLPSDEEIEKIPGFMFCKYLGGHNITIFPANEFNMYYKEIPLTVQYKLIKQIFAGKGIYPKMIKKNPKDDSLNNICKHFKISKERAKEYITYLSDKEIKEINEIYKIPKN